MKLCASLFPLALPARRVLWHRVFALLQVTALPALPAAAASLPDTGQDLCYNGSTLVACASGNTGDASSYPGQDGRFGRDPAFAQGAIAKSGGGQKGFDYTKLDASGNALAIQNGAWATSGGYDSGSEAAGTKWSCVTDNTTGLTWEVKTKDATPGLRDMNNTYTWYNSDSGSNAGNAGSTGSNTCNSTLPSNLCNTAAYIAALNIGNLCGFNDWRLPNYRELGTLVHLGTYNPAIDGSYFPNTQATPYDYWSANSYVGNPTAAWTVQFRYGFQSTGFKATAIYTRLVRGGPF